MAVICGWGEATGARRVSAAELEREFSLKPGKIARGAGIESVARVHAGEDELTLGVRAAQEALRAAGAGVGDVDWLVAASETHTGFPSLAARLHAALLAGARAAALDVGGGCLGAVSALGVARALAGAGTARRILVVTADVHSRMLTPARVKGEFGALFGDGASAFLVAAAGEAGVNTPGKRYRIGEVVLGCNPAASAAIAVRLDEANGLALTFDGEALSRAALAQLESLIADLALAGGVNARDAAAFATHQPNPRLVTVLARQMDVAPEKFPPVARTCGNLGSSTCGVALSRALAGAAGSGTRGPVFVASLGPGLLYGGCVLTRE